MRKILIIIFFIFPVLTFADASQRKCLLLPIQDSVGGAVAFKVFEEIERYLKESEWCYYRSNSEILSTIPYSNDSLAFIQ
jgi:hypothetical protein